MQNQSLEALAKAFVSKNLPDSMLELTGEIPFETIAPYREAALKHMAEHVEMPGFRPGKVPADLIIKKVGEVAVLEEAVELFIQDFYLALIEAHKIDAVGRPEVSITKLAPGNPVALTIRTAIYPTVTLPKNWKATGEKIPAEAVAPATDEEVAQTIESLRKSTAQAAANKSEPILDAEGKPLPPALPEVTDEWAKTLGAFDTVDALKAQITSGITEEKARTARDQRRGKIIDALLSEVAVEIPPIFVESELDKIIGQMQEDVARFGLTFEGYLKSVNKTEADMRNEFREQAKKRAKLQLTLNKIAEEAKVEADKEAVEAEMKHALEHFPDAKPDLLRIHIETVLRNEQVLKMLEGSEK